ncbi:MAG: methionine-rich copper-binding protein CopC [Pseudohongiellaceae bacterium]|jgi:methionine-rich copper-binding protein CopC
MTIAQLLMGTRRLLVNWLSLCLGLLLCLPASAQHAHGVLTPGVTFPQDDAVLNDPPRMITMSFRVDVRLLKLALFTDNGQWINLGFQYDPSRLNDSFVLPIPEELPPANYYIAKWSVTDDRSRLLNGEFLFSFGPNAIPPSEFIESQVSDKVETLPSTGSYRINPLEK